MKVYLIRHGKTRGNLNKCYVGRNDEPILEKELEKISNFKAPICDEIYISPMLRCRQTKDVLYPNRYCVVVDDFRECDFGRFEGKNYNDLKDDEDYQRWIDSGGGMPFPDGENVERFKQRCVLAFKNVLENIKPDTDSISLIVHGGTIMSILEYFEESHEYFKWQCGNCEGFCMELIDGECVKVWKISG